MKNKTNIAIGVLLLIIVVLTGYIILKDPVVVIKPFDDGPLREEIRLEDSISTHWKDQAQAWQKVASILEHRVDSLQKIKISINNDYNDQINFNSTATNAQLDSFIRANW